jgi:hypothetical protein
MAMPITRFFAYAGQMTALRTEEHAQMIEATSFPHMDKRSRKKASRRIENTLSPPRRRDGTQPARPLRMIGDMPADVAALQALESQGSLLRGLVTVIRKEKKGDEAPG